MALTGIRAIRLRMSGHRVSIVESMLQAGIYYFGKHTSIEVHVATNQPFIVAIVFGLHISMVITFVTVECAAQLVFQRMTQVLTVVMISHMFLNLRGTDPRAQERTESNRVARRSLMDRETVYQTHVSLDTWFIGPEKMSNVVGSLGNDLVPTPLSNY
jgi:hypothetical protein